MSWRSLLPQLLTSGSFRTQAELVRALSARGHPVDQATVSRELRSLGAAKVEGVYRLPPPPELGAPIHQFDTTAGGCLAVVRTDPAFASVVGQFIDDAALPGVLGTIAGDDTVFVATRGPEVAARLGERLGLRRPARGRRPRA